MKNKLTQKNIRLFITAKKKKKRKMIEFYDYFDHLKNSFHWKDGFISYKITFSSDEKHLFLKYNYDIKISSDELSRIIKYHTGLKKRQENYTDTIPSLYINFKKVTILRGENFDANYREIVRYNAYAKETDLNQKTGYINENDYTRISCNHKKYVLFIKIASKFDVGSADLMKTYVSNYCHKNKKFLKKYTLYLYTRQKIFCISYLVKQLMSIPYLYYN